MEHQSSLYISDLDGTLLNRSGTLSDGCTEGLRQLLAEGMLFSIATARSLFSIQQLLGHLQLPLPVVSFNGAFLSDVRSGRHEVVHSIDPAIARDIYHHVHQFSLLPFLSTYNGEEDIVYYSRTINEGMNWYLQERLERGDPRWRKVERLEEGLDEEVICITMIARPEELHDLYHLLTEEYPTEVEVHFDENMYSPGWHWLTVHDHRATKDRGIRELRRLYGLEDHRLVVFGDGTNDLKMFREADHGVAVANAVEQLKACAAEVIGHHDEGSVVNYLNRIGLVPTG